MTSAQTTYAPCPACDSTERVEKQYLCSARHSQPQLMVVCRACEVSAPADLWDRLPRVTDPDDGERL